MEYLYKLLDFGLIDSIEVREWIEYYHNYLPEVAQDIQQKQTLTLKGMNTFEHELSTYISVRNLKVVE